MELALAMSTKYSTKQLFDILEFLDVHDSLKKLAQDKADLAAKNKKG